MIRTTARTAKKLHRCCGCERVIAAGERYLEQVASPHHDDLNNEGWWRLNECVDCATRYDRGPLLEATS